AAAKADGTPIGCAGQLARRVAERLKLRQDVFVAELQLDDLYAAYRQARAAMRYAPLPRFPAVERDFSLLLADGTPFEEVVEVIRSLGITELTDVEAVDVYRGGHIPRKYSLLVRVTFQSHDATLTEAQLSDFSGGIVACMPLAAISAQNALKSGTRKPKRIWPAGWSASAACSARVVSPVRNSLQPGD